MDYSLVMAKGLASLDEAMNHAQQGHPRRMGHSGEFRQNMVRWRMERHITPVFLPREPHEQYEKAKRIPANSRRQWRAGEPGGLYSPWGCKKSDMIEQLNDNIVSVSPPGGLSLVGGDCRSGGTCGQVFPPLHGGASFSQPNTQAGEPQGLRAQDMKSGCEGVCGQVGTVLQPHRESASCLHLAATQQHSLMRGCMGDYFRGPLSKDVL